MAANQREQHEIWGWRQRWSFQRQGPDEVQRQVLRQPAKSPRPPRAQSHDWKTPGPAWPLGPRDSTLQHRATRIRRQTASVL